MGAARGMHDPETVRRTDCPLTVPAGGGRGYALGDRGDCVGTRRQAAEAPAGDVTSQGGRGIPCGSGFMALNGEGLVEGIVQVGEQNVFPVGHRHHPRTHTAPFIHRRT